MSRPNDATEPFIAESEVSGADANERQQQRRQRRQIQQERRRAFRDRHFQEANIHGLRCREFEADLRLGERLMGGEPIRVKLTKTISFCRRLFLALLTCGVYELWFRCCACGSRVFDVDARMGVTNLGRLLLWTHTAGGGGLPLPQHFFRAITQPSAILFIAIFVLFFAFGPVLLQTDILQVAGLVAAVLAVAVVLVFWQWLFERASLQVDTGLRQFEAAELSHTRLICYRNRSLWGLGGETLACQVYLFFGFYPKEQQLNRTLPPGMFDAGFIPIGQPLDSSGAGLDASKLQAAAGQGNPTTTQGFTAVASAILILLAFAGFLNEVTEFLVQWVHCVVNNYKKDIGVISQCVEQRFDSWWTGGVNTGPQTVIAHWIEALDWSLQLLLFIWVVGPTAFFLWKTLSDQSSAGLGFVVDRRLGASTEDEKFEEHWKELSSFVADLFQGACGEDATSRDAGCMPRQSLGAADSQRPKAMRWEEVPGDIQPAQPETEGGQGAPPQNEMEAPSTGDPVRAGYQAASSSSSPYEPKAAARSQRRAPSWQQVEEMISHLIDPISGKVRVYRDVLSFLPDEEVLAVYPEKIIMPIVAKVKIIITCGLEYYLHWRRQRRDGAIILTDKRLIHVVTHFSRYKKSLKVDMYTVGKSVRYVGLRPPRWQCCARPAGDLSVATRLGTMEVRLLQMKRLRDCAQRMWQGFAALQDTQSVSSVEYDDWASVAEDFEESDAAEQRSASEDLEMLEEAKEEAGALWGDNSGDAAVDADLEEGIPAEAVAEQVQNEDEGIVRFSATRAELWGLVMAPGEKPLWGPCLFEEEVFRACCPQRRGARNRRRPASLVTFTDGRLIVIQYRSVGPLCCGGICHRAPVDNVSIIPLKNVLGFSVEERFSMQRAMIVKLMAKACCRPMSESFLCVKVLSNAALGKVYLDSLSVRQRVLPLFADPPCNFEEDKVLELRRWLGNVALFFSGASEKVSQRPVLELWRCERGLAPE